MTREIKFRAWNKEERNWAYLNQLTDWGLAEMTVCIGYGNDTYPYQTMMIKSDDTYELMQYTGLKDKKGKMIFEGDVVEVFERGLKAAIEFYDGAFYACDYEDKNRILLSIMNNEASVIGNIWEHPELLDNQT